MTYQERKCLVNILSNVLISSGFALYLNNLLSSRTESDIASPSFWAVQFLVFVGAMIVSKIAILIIFSILNAIATQDLPPKNTDERDVLIELKSNRSEYWVFGLGVVLAAVTLAVGMPVYWFFLVVTVASMAGDTLSSTLAFRWYRKGF